VKPRTIHIRQLILYGVEKAFKTNFFRHIEKMYCELYLYNEIEKLKVTQNKHYILKASVLYFFISITMVTEAGNFPDSLYWAKIHIYDLLVFASVQQI